MKKFKEITRKFRVKSKHDKNKIVWLVIVKYEDMWLDPYFVTYEFSLKMTHNEMMTKIPLTID
jgi:hypothetical protein